MAFIDDDAKTEASRLMTKLMSMRAPHSDKVKYSGVGSNMARQIAMFICDEKMNDNPEFHSKVKTYLSIKNGSNY